MKSSVGRLLTCRTSLSTTRACTSYPPTLTTESTAIDEVQLLDGYTVNLTSASSDWGSCTSPDVKMCSVTSNATLGRIIPPVRSARITTKGKKSFKYARVEIVAKMPKGDWLWPAICAYRLTARARMLTHSRDDAGRLYIRSMAQIWPD